MRLFECENCRKELFGKEIFFCEKCYLDIMKYLRLTRDEEDYIVYSLFFYKGEIKSLIRNMKFHDKRYISKIFAYLLYEFIKQNNIIMDIISYIPMHNYKKLVRGYDQADDISYELAKLLNKPQVCIGKRKRWTKSLYRLTKPERIIQLKDSFEIVEGYQDKRIIIIDDIYTTGSTVGEFYKSLKMSGYDKLIFTVIAR